jgi:hypothetical protein
MTKLSDMNIRLQLARSYIWNKQDVKMNAIFYFLYFVTFKYKF